jgi:molybdate transport system substrate-binding protein
MRLLTLALALLFSAGYARAQDLTVFVALSLTNAMEEVGAKWRAEGKGALKLSFGSSSTLARQIEQGAAADLFVSADEAWMDYLATRGLIAADSRVAFLSNALVLVAPAERAKPVELSAGIDLAALLGADGRLVTGDPAHVPVGRYARQALEKLGLWAVAEPRLARAENVRAALLLVERGEAPFGIVYATDAAIAPKVKVVATFPPDSHAPISYPMALVKARDGTAARAFIGYLTGAEARAVYGKYGFVVRWPG